MPDKLLRLGFTESTLFLLHYYRTSNVELSNNQSMKNMEKTLLNWLYTTSGFYDKQLTCKYMKAPAEAIYTPTYNAFMQQLYEMIQTATHLQMCFHNQFDNAEQLTSEFVKHCQHFNSPTFGYIFSNQVYEIMKHRRVLFISPFASLMKQQIDNGNCKKIYNNSFPEIISVEAFDYIYTYLNYGPDDNILDTCDKQFQKITSELGTNYDVVIISCGAHSCILANKFFSLLQKHVCTLGGEMQGYFGVLNKRHKSQLNSTTNLEHWITEIPASYRPSCYLQIEGGCYW